MKKSWSQPHFFFFEIFLPEGVFGKISRWMSEGISKWNSEEISSWFTAKISGRNLERLAEGISGKNPKEIVYEIKKGFAEEISEEIPGEILRISWDNSETNHREIPFSWTICWRNSWRYSWSYLWINPKSFIRRRNWLNFYKYWKKNLLKHFRKNSCRNSYDTYLQKVWGEDWKLDVKSNSQSSN